MESIKVVLANSSKLLHDMVKKTIQKMEGLEILGDTRKISEIQTLINHHKPDWLIVGLSDQGDLPLNIEDLMEQNDNLSVVAMSKIGDRIRILEKNFQGQDYQNPCLSDLWQVLFQKLQKQL